MTTIQANIQRVINERANHWKANGEPLAAISETRELTPAERAQWEAAEATFRGYDERIEALRRSEDQERSIAEFSGLLERSEAGQAHRAAERDSEQWRDLATGERAALRSDESIRQHPAFIRSSNDTNGLAEANYGSLGAMLRALATGGAGSAIVPAAWSGQLIDLTRAESQVIKAGATVVPMTAKTLTIGRQTGDPTAAFRAEGSAVTASDPTFDSVTLDAKTVTALVVGSNEWFADALGAEEVITRALAEAMAQKIDQAALYGGTIAGAGAINLPTPPNPRGVLAAMLANRPANVLGTAAADGTDPAATSFWGEVVDSIYTVKDSNETPTALLWSTKLERRYARQTDTTGQPLGVPAALDGIQRLSTNQIVSYTKGTNTTATDLFVADWRQLLVGVRQEITLQPLRELYQGTGQIGILATARIDVQLARPSAFAIYRALKGAA